ncbi:alpha/beta hydrolase [Oscillochloris sp. ZM17-4]|uniref:alpha/beta hydrolase n=1 Tax=Oscillochloris sp. ZM17-4 TaxID=2866714 RepID=UPI001C72F758|nr:alpha/beta fold hydrolase [Oscillochloris sp. ZM17-4]MBX0329222.1 alpha/beta hydrolase [Oscillochloris sp. ZM17-4]
MPYRVTHTIQNGIERVVYTPEVRRFATPIVMQHGMWHGAWCWQEWQALLAEWGWESHAHSLPGHGRSPERRPIRWCTLQYYYEFLNDEVRRMARPPVLMGHSMGGALTQWFLKYGPTLPAAVLVAPWSSHSMQTLTTFETIWRLDPLGLALMFLTLSANPMTRSPRHAAACFTSAGAIMSPHELHARLGPESALVLLQYQPPWWRPARPEDVKTPLLWLAGAADAVIPEPMERRSAAYYGADYVVIPEAGHDLMLEKSYAATVRGIHEWLAGRVE